MQARWCPSCFHKLDATTSMEGEHAPQPGDFTVCIGCAEYSPLQRGYGFRAFVVDGDTYALADGVCKGDSFDERESAAALAW
jgi:hypothetical protein